MVMVMAFGQSCWTCAQKRITWGKCTAIWSWPVQTETWLSFCANLSLKCPEIQELGFDLKLKLLKHIKVKINQRNKCHVEWIMYPKQEQNSEFFQVWRNGLNSNLFHILSDFSQTTWYLNVFERNTQLVPKQCQCYC